MPVIATAGHVDHGKSTLIEALTGRNPDRLAEEKQRGMTIDLGFAWTTLASGRAVGFVDVPGHQRFIANMLAGVGSVSSALLVVAADEGWKPQTEEHLAALDLLGIHRVAVGLTKSDLTEEVESAVERVREHLVGTLAASAPIVPVSARTGEGLDALRQVLDELTVDAIDADRPSLWIDRVFTVKGAGTVVTGTLTGGSLSVGQELASWPGNRQARVRTIESHEQRIDRAPPGSRVGVNLVGAHHSDLARGTRLALPGALRATSRFHGTFRRARYVDQLRERGAYQIHVGTATVAATLRKMGADHVLVQLASPLWLEAGDRYLLRDAGRHLVVGGGLVLDPAPQGRGSEISGRSQALSDAWAGGRDRLATVLLETRGMANRADLTAWSGGGLPSGVGDGDVVSDERAAQLVEAAQDVVESYHREHPLEAGMTVGGLAKAMGLDEGLTRLIAGKSSELVLDGATVARVGAGAASVDPAWELVAAHLRTAAPPTLDELAVPLEVLRRLIRDGRVVRVADNLVYLPEVLQEVVARARSLGKPFTVSEFRQLIGVSRKHAVPLLEHFDREGTTIRQGNQRTLRS